MEKKTYFGDKSVKNIYLNVSGVNKRVRRLYFHTNNTNKLCYSCPKVTFKSTLDLILGSTEGKEINKDVFTDTAYGTFPTASSNSNRVDFWCYPNATAKFDSTKKYVDNPWCIYCDANSANSSSGLYKSCGYTEDKLAEHWATEGYKSSSGFILGGLSAADICTETADHTIQHCYSTKTISISATCGTAAKTYADLYNSSGTLVRSFTMNGNSVNGVTGYPGMYFIFHARHQDGTFNVGSDGSACAVNINGTKVSGRGDYTYTLPRNISKLVIAAASDNHWDGGVSFNISVTTTAVT